MNKHIEFWVKNAFDEWRLFCGFDTSKFIVGLSEDEGLIKDLWICCFLLFCKLQKKMATYILLLSTLPYNFLNASLQEKLFFVS
jgi:hypothetical protein